MPRGCATRLTETAFIALSRCAVGWHEKSPHQLLRQSAIGPEIGHAVLDRNGADQKIAGELARRPATWQAASAMISGCVPPVPGLRRRGGYSPPRWRSRCAARALTAIPLLRSSPASPEHDRMRRTWGWCRRVRREPFSSGIERWRDHQNVRICFCRCGIVIRNVGSAAH